MSDQQKRILAGLVTDFVVLAVRSGLKREDVVEAMQDWVFRDELCNRVMEKGSEASR